MMFEIRKGLPVYDCIYVHLAPRPHPHNRFVSMPLEKNKKCDLWKKLLTI